MILENKTVVVSGVGPGLGGEIARLALRDGARVVIAARKASALEARAKQLDPSGERIAACRADITQEADCAALAGFVGERFGAPDALVQVAAYEGAFGGLQDAELEKWRLSFDTNVVGSVNLMRALAPGMKQGGGGSIVLIGSQSMYSPQLPQAGYAASKGALLSTMYYLAGELGPDRIRVNMVVPSWMWGPPVEGYLAMRAKQEGRDSDQLRGEIESRIPLREIVPDEEVAEAVVFLASDRARCITGQALMVNGGELMR